MNDQQPSRAEFGSGWMNDYRRKMVSAERAAKEIKSGDRVYFPLVGPGTIHQHIADRREELRDVKIHMARPFRAQARDFASAPGWERSFSIEHELFIGDENRWATDERISTYNPVLFSLEFKPYDESRPEAKPVDVLVVNVTPPNSQGFCNFGHELWHKRAHARRARTVLAEVDDTLITAHGNAWIHVSEIDYFVETKIQLLTEADIEAIIAKANPEWRDELRELIPKIDPLLLATIGEAAAAFPPSDLAGALGLADPPDSTKRIAEHVSELIDDGDCFQCGVGEPSASMARLGAFDDKNDLGIQTEMTAPGIPMLVARGIATGKYKNIHRGIAVGTSWSGATKEDREFIHENPLFEVYDAEYAVNIKTFAQNDNQVAINSAISIDLFGQINSETAFGPRMINGSGGQPECHMGAMLSKGGRAITLLPSTRMNGAISSIVPTLEEGSTVTIPRHWADLIVTEYGVARLLGKNHQERAEALIRIAHPDFRDELRAAAKEFLYP